MRSRDFNKKKKFYPEFKRGLRRGRLSVVSGICLGIPAGLAYGAYTAYEVYGLVAGGTVALSAVTAGLGIAGIVAGMTSFAVSGIIGLGESVSDSYSVINQTSFAKKFGRNLVSLTALGVLAFGGVKVVKYSDDVVANAIKNKSAEKTKTGLNIECKDKFNILVEQRKVSLEVKSSKVKFINSLKGVI